MALRSFTKLLAVILLLPLSSCGTSSQGLDTVTNEGGSAYYEIFVRSFFDANDDGIGDFNGITSKLDYLQGLGISGIWLMPIHESPTYHKYDVIDYLSIDDEYGTMTDFEEYISAASARNINTIIDLVLNHTSIEHPWFIEGLAAYKAGNCAAESSKCHYYNFSSTLLDGYTNYGDGAYGEARFYSGMPDLNLDNPYVKAEIEQIVSFWFGKGVKGFRLDAVTSYFTGQDSKNIEFLSWFNTMVKAQNPSSYVVAEGPWATGPLNLLTYYESGIDSYFNFPISVYTTRLTGKVRTESGFEMASYMADYNNDINDISPLLLDAPFLSNHDQGRIAGILFADDNPARQKLLASSYMLLPGKPFMYYSEEIGLRGSGRDENKRLPLIWSATDKVGETTSAPNADYDMDNQVTIGISEQLADSTSLLNHYKTLLAIRNRYNSLIETARLTALNLDSKLYALRYDVGAEHIIIITNYGLAAVTTSISGQYRLSDQLMYAGVASSVELNSENTNISISPCSTVVLSVKN